MRNLFCGLVLCLAVGAMTPAAQEAIDDTMVARMGAVDGARAIEPLCIHWCIPGFRSNSWTHAFKLLKR